MTSLRARLLLSVIIVGVLGGVATFGASALFSATTQNSGDEVSAGTVAISNNSAGQAMFNINGANPGDTWSRCVKVTYTGSLPADVHIYLGGALGPLAQYLNVTIDSGATTGADTFPQCTTFTAGSTVYDGPIVPGSDSYDLGLPVDPTSGSAPWTTGSTAIYRFTLSLPADTPNTGQSQSSGILTAYWEAHNQ